MAYEFSFASVYDIFTDGVEYDDRADYIYELLKKYGVTDGTLLDVACGTGSLSECFLKKGFEVVANDISVDMLNIAREKLTPYGDRAVLLCQDMRELDLFGTVDCAVCALDSLNHLLSKKDVEQALASTALFIRPGGVFVFDVNSIYKHRSVLSDNTFVYEDEGNAFLVWQNSECDEDDIVDMYIDIFTSDIDGKYIRNSDYIVERAYSVDFIKEALKKCGFELLGIFGDMKLCEPHEKEERIYFAAKKI